MNTASIIEYLDAHMSEKRRKHTEGVRDTAMELARRYGADEAKAEIAALCHDIYRGVPVEELDRMVKELGLDKARYLGNANLSHGKLAEQMLPELFGIEDRDILNAVSYHTTGRAGMSVLEKVVFLADAIEPNRDYPGVEELRRVTEDSLDLGCYRSLTGTIRHLEEQGMGPADIDPDTLKAADYFRGILEKKDHGK